jgi:hypothetical protein
MKILSGNYKKKDGSSREVKLFILENKTDSFSGIDVSLLTESEKEILKKAHEEYWDKVSPLMKTSYRQFIKESFIEPPIYEGI